MGRMSRHITLSNIGMLLGIDGATIPQIETTILENRRITECQLVHEVKISYRSVDKTIYDHIHDIHMLKVSA